jgi:hypothetical protein
VSRQLTYLLVADGGTDRALAPIIEWAIHRLDPEVEILEPDFRKRRAPVQEFLDALDTGAMIVFVHRDGEGAPLATRLQEFDGVTRTDVVPVVPIRMTEAWLLIDGAAIARAADRPSAVVAVPNVNQLEGLANPKQALDDLLLAAAGNLTGRRRKQFAQSIVERRVNIASLIDDYSTLESLPAFQQFQADLAVRYPYQHVITQ